MLAQTSRRIARCVFALCCVLAAFAPAQVAGQAGRREVEVRKRLRELIDASGAETVGVAFHDLETNREVMLDESASFHAASTMKVPVMLELFEQSRAGRLSLDARVPVKNDFKSIADGSSFSVAPEDDSEQSLYKQIGGEETVRRLLHLMITESSNLATNILIELVTPKRIMGSMRKLGARDIRVLRGVEDGKAYERGLNNTTTARDLLVILRAIAAGRAVSKDASDEMVRVLLAQKFNKGLPAGLPSGLRVAHKTGSITRISHDAGIVYVPGRKPYVLVVLTRGIAEETRAHQLIADISKAIYEGMIK
jgi:beta-lactamase class A